MCGSFSYKNGKVARFKFSDNQEIFYIQIRKLGAATAQIEFHNDDDFSHIITPPQSFSLHDSQ